MREIDNQWLLEEIRMPLDADRKSCCCLCKQSSMLPATFKLPTNFPRNSSFPQKCKDELQDAKRTNWRANVVTLLNTNSIETRSNTMCLHYSNEVNELDYNMGQMAMPVGAWHQTSSVHKCKPDPSHWVAIN